jgi:glutamate-1-semialdehyde 2,1-aminomutase
MYLVRLARAYSRKRVIVKMAGGWHGYNTELNKGVRRPFDRTESEGILPEEQAYVRMVTFNNLEAADRAVRESRDDVAAILLEPVLGAGGCIPADRDYLKGLREIADRAGTILAFDEIITGFRLALGGAQEWYRVKPDLAALGKIAGGGLPLGLVCGRKEIVSLADPTRKDRFVSIGGGTFSENPLSMTAGLATIRYLRERAGSIYPGLAMLGERVRSGVDAALNEEGISAHTTGAGSLFLTHFGSNPRNAEETAGEDLQTRKDYVMHLLANGIFMIPGHPGGVSTAHSKKDIEQLVVESGKFAATVKSTGNSKIRGV